MQGQVQNYATLTKRFKVQHEKKLHEFRKYAEYGFEQISMKCIEIFIS